MQGISRLAVSGGEDAISTHCWKTEAGRRVPAEDGLGPPLHMCSLRKEQICNGVVLSFNGSANFPRDLLPTRVSRRFSARMASATAKSPQFAVQGKLYGIVLREISK